jgi:hypothetical protein
VVTIVPRLRRICWRFLNSPLSLEIQSLFLAAVTLPQPRDEDSFAIINRLRGALAHQPESMDWLEQNGFHRVMKQPTFEAFKKE